MLDNCCVNATGFAIAAKQSRAEECKSDRGVANVKR
jgi:hypothetical protein